MKLTLPKTIAMLLASACLLCTLTAPAGAQAQQPKLLILGDSISAAYGLPAGSGWVELLSKRLAERGYLFRVVNASISGDTTAGGRARLPVLLSQHHPAIVVIELGGNDGLRGGDLKATRDNLDSMVALAQHAGTKVLIVGMQLPPNYGGAYTREFNGLFAAVASKRKVPLVPFFFEGFGERSEFFQADRVHPTVEAQPKLLDNVWPQLEPLLGKAK
jgi:acyl-CoA thioesterase-1